MLKHLEDSEDLKVGLSELKEQLDTPEEAGFSIMQIAKQARNERGQRLFQVFRLEENEVYIASLARWDTQLKGLVELGRRCQGMMQEVKLSSERREVLKGMGVEDKREMQKEAKSIKRRFLRELEEQRAKEALELVQKKPMLIKCEGERERARMLQRLVGSRVIKHWNDVRDFLSVESCSPSMACDVEGACSESSRKMQDKQETTSDVSWTEVTKGKEKEMWRLKPEGEAARTEATVPWNGVEGVSVNPEGESRHVQVRAKIARKERENQTQIGRDGFVGRHLATRVRRCRVRKAKRFGGNLKKRRIM